VRSSSAPDRAGASVVARKAPRRRVAASGTGSAVASVRREQRRLALLLVLPPFVVYAVFKLYPFLGSIYYSLTSWDGVSPSKDWVWLDNYGRMLGDERMWNALSHNAIWAVLGTIAPVATGFVLAVLLWEHARFVALFRTLYFVPFILPTVVVSTIWSWIYNPIFGLLNSGLRAVGLDSITRAWLGDPHTALYAVLLAASWAAFGFVVVVLLAGLQRLDTALIDAAIVDGAGWWQRIRYVILPGIAPVLTMVTAVTLIGAFAVFDLVFIMTAGGPGYASDLLGIYTYTQAFTQNDVGYGAALSMIITVLSLATAVAFVRLRERSRVDV
jgi:raffinose/stachyose/melibiose transport system permease protein